jgi:hypothetical protein
MVIFGSMALGLVMGWVSVLVGRGTSGPFGVSWGALIFAGVSLLAAAILAFFYGRANGALASLIAFGVGAFAARAVLGPKVASGMDQTGA